MSQIKDTIGIIEKLNAFCTNRDVKSLKINGESIEIEFYNQREPIQEPSASPVESDVTTLEIDPSFSKDLTAEEIDHSYDELPISDPEAHEDLLAKEMLGEYGDPDYENA